MTSGRQWMDKANSELVAEMNEMKTKIGNEDEDRK